LPTGVTQTAETGNNAQPLGETAGSAMAPSESVTTITTGTGVDENNADAMAPKPVSERKTRFTDREKETEANRAEQKVSKAEVKVSKRPTPATSTETADEKVRAAPLGLNGNTGPAKKKKQPKTKHVKGEQKERLQEKPKPVDTTPPIAPTANPALGGTPAPASQTAPASQAPAAGTQSPTSGASTPQ
jgi:peptidyl-prolyl cis-trans isomerase SurA